MEIKVNNKTIKHWQNLAVTLRYDTLASTFSFAFVFNPDIAEHKEICRPMSYAPVTVTHNGELLITGTMLQHPFKHENVPDAVGLGGYSKTGVLEDCEIPLEAYPLQSTNINLKNIAEKLIKPFGLKLVVDPSVSSKVNNNFKNTTANPSQSIKAYLSELASQQHIILTHDEHGNVVLTEAKAKQQPIYSFKSGMPGVSIELQVDAQQMHKSITMRKQATKKNPNATKADVTNPYVSAYRPRVVRQSSGDDVNTPLAARNMLSEELRAIKLTITMDRWDINGKIIRPNNIVKVQDPYNYLYNPTNFFIEAVDYTGDEAKEQAVLTCVLPEVYNGQTPKNIFV